MYRILCVCIASFFLLTACGGESSSCNDAGCEGADTVGENPPGNTGPDNTTGDKEPDYTELKPAAISPEHLKHATKSELESLLKNGMRLDVATPRETGTPDRDGDDVVESQPTPVSNAPADNGGQSTNAGGDNAGGESADGATTDSASGKDGGSFSGTNVHVTGVDESDYVKYDGNHIFMSTSAPYYWAGEGEKPSSEIRILKSDPDTASAEEVGSIPLADDYWGDPSQLYLVQDAEQNTQALTTIRSASEYYYFDDIAVDVEPATDIAIGLPYFPTRNRIQLAVHDVSDPSAPGDAWELEIDGSLHGSRKIGNMLYLITQYYPHITSIVYNADNLEKRSANEATIADAELSSLLPTASINGGEDFSLINDNDCLIPVDTDESHGYHSLMTVVAVDLSTKEIASTACLNANIQGIYSSGEHLYIGASDYASWSGFNSFTVIHKFALNSGDISYRSTGTVEGTLGWDDPSFRMDERAGYLRVVTTTRNEEWQPSHHLSVFKDSDTTDSMDIVAQIPNEAQPAPIGKPNEDIYAVRFIADKAFIVTFERIDPLYVIDLSTPEEPEIAGELEVPGFSSYLHPVGEQYLLGIGSSATDDGQQNGVKASLYDVSDITDPQEVSSMTIGGAGSSTPVAHDLRAISFLQTSSDQLRFTMPISVQKGNWVWEHDALYLFEINGLEGDTASLNQQGSIIANEASEEQPYSRYWIGRDRGIMHDDAVYYTHGTDVWSTFWSSPETRQGPY